MSDNSATPREDFMSDVARDLIRDEGEVLHAYKDSLGYWTIGVGRLIDGRKSGGITRAESRYLLANDIEGKIRALDEAIPWWKGLDDTRRRVLVNMAFNLGIAGLLGFRATLAAIKRGDYEQAAINMLDSKWSRQVGARAVRLAALMRRDGDSGDNGNSGEDGHG